MSRGLLNIRKAADYLDVTEDCLRKWEKSGKITPLRTAGGHRRYKMEDLERLVGIESDRNMMKKRILELVSISGNGNDFEEIKSWLEEI